ncbi:MAG: ABC transporter substrate-binding protein [Vannielia sp.]|nr:ABC transporter substrate-binding protein [Vannielia sp.]MDF1872891.1 ABC transporter substrate-binding protein [Vannielia sp.]
MRHCIAAVAAGWLAGSAAMADDLSVTATWLHVDLPPAPTLSNLDPVPEDLGRAGAELAIKDNQTTGSFLGHSYELQTISAPPEEALEAAKAALQGATFLVTDARAPLLQAIADMPEAEGALIFNVADPAMALRGEGCRANLFHTGISRAMWADALAQFLVQRRWSKAALIAGPRENDRALATAIERSLTKFGLKPPARKDWQVDTDLRRSASAEVPLFTQGLGDYDLLILADEANDYARYIAYNTVLPRPVGGAEGLRPVGWDRVVEQWGAAQLQSRFGDLAGRDMQNEDYAAWAALRAVGEAVTRVNSDDPAALRAFMLSDAFELAGFKGRPLSFRRWNGQLRQPVPLVHGGAVVAQAPLEGFLHQRNELDTLGLDKPESACAAYEE